MASQKITDYSEAIYQKGIVTKPDFLVFTIDNFLSHDECQSLIEKTEKRGYEPAMINGGMGQGLYDPTYRKSDRCIIDDPEMATWFWERLKDHIPQKFNGHDVVGLNERMRFLRYDKGDFFKPHLDASYRRPDNTEASHLTFFLYLNEGYTGGASTFVHPQAQFIEKMDTEQNRVPCPPQTGRLLVFQHNICHEGALLKKGRKYVVRTDVMYRRK